jgi:hypothetical protein
MRRPDEPRRIGSIAERRADFGDKVREIGFRHESGRPQAVL